MSAGGTLATANQLGRPMQQRILANINIIGDKRLTPRAGGEWIGEPTSLLVDCGKSVSYTHLDVYKRQRPLETPTIH